MSTGGKGEVRADGESKGLSLRKNSINPGIAESWGSGLLALGGGTGLGLGDAKKKGQHLEKAHNLLRVNKGEKKKQEIPKARKKGSGLWPGGTAQ